MGPILFIVDKAFEPNFNIWSNAYNSALTKALKAGLANPRSNTFESSFEKHVGLSLDDFYKNFNQFIMDNTVPPVGFFPTKPLNELVDFYSINSGWMGYL